MENSARDSCNTASSLRLSWSRQGFHSVANSPHEYGTGAWGELKRRLEITNTNIRLLSKTSLESYKSYQVITHLWSRVKTVVCKKENYIPWPQTEEIV